MQAQANRGTPQTIDAPLPESLFMPEKSMTWHDFKRNHRLIAQCQLAQAKTHCERLMQQSIAQYGENSIMHAHAQWQMGAWHFTNSDYAAAEPLLKQAIQTLRRHLDQKITQSAQGALVWALYYLGNVQQMQAQSDVAYQTHQEAWSLLPKHRHNSEIAVLILIAQGVDLMQQGQWSQSLDKHECAAATSADKFGMHDGLTAYAYTHVAAHYRHQGHWHEAHSILQHTVQDLRQCYSQHPHLALAWREWGIVCDLLGEHEQAAQCFAHAEKQLRQCVGEQHSQYADLMLMYAGHQRQFGDANKAILYLHHALSVYLTIFDENHPAVQMGIRLMTHVMMENLPSEEDNEI